MVNTFLPEDLTQKKVIQNIYDELVEKIYKDIHDIDLKCEYLGTIYDIQDRKNIKAFLLSKDFYNYKVICCEKFWDGIRSFHGNTKIKTILEGDKSKEFQEQYDKDRYEEEYKRLNSYRDLSVSKFKELEFMKEMKSTKDIFSYDKLPSDNRHQILCEMDVLVCPYCNINYTLSYEINDSKKKNSTADLDHFYPKNKYPEYGLCLYNFVPSCSVCNSRLKNQKDISREKYIFPNEESVEGKAAFKIKNLAEVMLNQSVECDVILESAVDNSKINNSRKLFKINERYKALNLYTKELIDKSVIYTDLYTDELEKLLDKTNVNVKELVFGKNMSEKEYARVSLGKLKNDLLKQLGLY